MKSGLLKRRLIVFIGGGPNVPSSRFRVNAVASCLMGEDVQCRVIHGYGYLDSRIRNRYVRQVYRLACRLIRALRTVFVRNADVVVVQRLALPFCSLPERFLAWRGIPVIFDFDDAIDLDSRWRRSRMRSRALRKMFRSSALVVAGNSWLARMVGDAAPTRIIPTCLDLSRYRPDLKRQNGNHVPVIGWMGTSSNYINLKQISGVIRRLREAGYEFRVCIVSELMDGDCINALGAEFRYWDSDMEVGMLRDFDIGVMPLIDSDWSRGKCGFKLIQYMAVGLPVVASDVGFNRDVVEDGVTGYLARSDADWVEALRSLITSRPLRRQMGQAGRERAETNFSLDRAVDEYRRCIDSVIEKFPVG